MNGVNGEDGTDLETYNADSSMLMFLSIGEEGLNLTGHPLTLNSKTIQDHSRPSSMALGRKKILPVTWRPWDALECPRYEAPAGQEAYNLTIKGPYNSNSLHPRRLELRLAQFPILHIICADAQRFASAPSSNPGTHPPDTSMQKEMRLFRFLLPTLANGRTPKN